MAAAGLRPSNPGSAAPRNSTISQGSQGGYKKSPMSSSSSPTTPAATNCLPSSSLFETPSEHADDSRVVTSQQKLNLVCMIQFATSLMTALNGINKQSFQVFKLRVGVNSGPVIAGIIGAQRPFYDIWGDCVNVSRTTALVKFPVSSLSHTSTLTFLYKLDRQSDGKSGSGW